MTLSTVTALLNAGFSVLPVKDKKPLVQWKEFQKRLMSEHEASRHFSNGAGVAVVCGAVSGNLVGIDLDDPEAFEPYLDLVRMRSPELVEKLCLHQSPRGYHIFVRSAEPVPGNEVWAKGEDGKARIETRGEGGYILIPPTPGYEVLHGGLLDCPSLSAEHLRLLQSTAECFDRGAKPEKLISVRKGRGHEQNPGDRYNEDTDIRELLTAYGWRPCGKTSAGEGWTRPGKTDGVSGVLLESTGNFYVWTSSVPEVESGKSYSAFGLFTMYQHSGSFKAAARALHEKADAGIDPEKVVTPWKRQDDERFDECIFSPPGMLGEIARWYNATAPQPQPLFATAAALALGSVVLGRRYNTGPHQNYTSLYMIIAAKSGTGKDHVRQVVRKILSACSLDWMERGEGFTSANTVIKALSRQPLQISFFEEIGQRLTEASVNPRSLAKGTFRKMLDLWSSCHSFSVGEEFADGTCPRVDRPALTVVGVSTPRALTEAITPQMIEQGFVNRILPFISMAERQVAALPKGRGENVPEEIVSFVKSIWLAGDIANSGVPVAPEPQDEVVVPLSIEALAFLDGLGPCITGMCNGLEDRGLEDMPTRMRETAMRVALIVAVFCGHTEVEIADVRWAWALVTALYRNYINEVKRHVAGSQHEHAKLEALEALRKLSPQGIRPKDLGKRPPWSKWTPRVRGEIIADLVDGGLMDMASVRTGGRGPATQMWVAVQ